MRTLASNEVPTPTTAMEKSFAPTWSRASGFEASASTIGSRSEKCATRAGDRSMASTSCPSRSSVIANDDPNRPRPMTSTPASFDFSERSDARAFGAFIELLSANDRPFLG